MYQDDPLEPEGGYAPSHYQGKDLDSASCPDNDAMEDVTQPLNHLQFTQEEGPVFHKIDVNKIQDLEDVKKILGALGLACTMDMVKEHGLEFLIKD
jgi:hypothetical protein